MSADMPDDNDVMSAADMSSDMSGGRGERRMFGLDLYKTTIREGSALNGCRQRTVCSKSRRKVFAVPLS